MTSSMQKNAGIHIEDRAYTKGEKEKISKREMAMKVLQSAADYYSKMLHTTTGKQAFAYFQKREFSDELVNRFELGYSPDSWDALTLEMRKQNYQNSLMIDAGLVIEKEDGGIYDRFRNRVMFPIHDHLGKVVGFGARLLDDEIKQAKYINSPQTDVYDKSKILYGLFQSRDEIRKKGYVILTEGYADVLTLHQAGYKNAVASSGTSLTKDQLLNLFRFCRTIYFVYDADSAGLKAVERGLGLALEHGFNVLVVQLPEGEDPDSIIRNLGGRNFQVYLDEAQQFLDFLVKIFKSEGKLENPAVKAESIRFLMDIIIKIPDRLQHDEYIKQLSALMNLSDRQVEQIYKEKEKLERNKNKFAKRNAEKGKGKRSGRQEVQETLKDKVTKDVDMALSEEMLPEENILIQLVLEEKDACQIMVKDFYFKPENLHTETGRNLLSHVYRMSEKYEDIVKGLFDDKEISESEKDLLTTLIFKEDRASDNWSKFSNRNTEKDLKRIIQDTIYRLDINTIEIMIQAINRKLKDDTSEDESSGMDRIQLLKEQQDLSIKKKKIEQLLIR